MREDVKIFFRYIFDFKEFLKIIGNSFKGLTEARSLSQLALILSLVVVLSIMFGKIASNFISWFVVLGLFVISLYFRYSIVYKGGEHRKWYRDKKGILPKKELIREEFDLRNDKS